jgi:hypothetical protein
MRCTALRCGGGCSKSDLQTWQTRIAATECSAIIECNAVAGCNAIIHRMQRVHSTQRNRREFPCCIIYIRVGLHRSEKAWACRGYGGAWVGGTPSTQWRGLCRGYGGTWVGALRVLSCTGYSKYSVAWSLQGLEVHGQGVLRVLNGLGLRGLEGLEAL